MKRHINNKPAPAIWTMFRANAIRNNTKYFIYLINSFLLLSFFSPCCNYFVGFFFVFVLSPFCTHQAWLIDSIDLLNRRMKTHAYSQRMKIEIGYCVEEMWPMYWCVHVDVDSFWEPLFDSRSPTKILLLFLLLFVWVFHFWFDSADF